MRFEAVDEVRHPRERVFHLIRDDMTSLVPYLPDVDVIEVLERRDEPGKVVIVNLWRGSQDRVPGAIKKFISRDTLSWKDHAVWDSEGRHADWRLEPHVGKGLFECSGRTTVLPGADDRSCRIQIQGELRVYPDRLPGVPGFLGRSIGGTVEKFVVDMLVPNMRKMASGVQRYFDERPA